MRSNTYPILLSAILLSAILLSSLVLTARPQEVADQSTATVTGIVVRQGTNEPVSGIQVRLSHPRKSEVAVTDESGNFAFPKVLPGRIELRPVTGKGLLGSNVAPALFTVSPDQRLSGVRVEVALAGTISGRITREDGQPVIKTTVSATRKEYQIDGHCLLKEVEKASTDDRGNYRIFDLEPGEYYVRVDNLAPQQTQGNALSRMFYPGTTDPGKARALSLEPGQSADRIDMTVVRTVQTNISGKIEVGPTSVPVTAMNIQLRRLDGCDPGSDTITKLSPTGFSAFTAAVPGSYEIVATLTSLPVDRVPALDIFLAKINLTIFPEYSSRTPLEFRGQAVDGLTLRIHTLSALRGLVTMKPDSQPVRLEGLRAVLNHPDGILTRRSPVAADGRFAITPNTADKHYLSIEGLPGDAYVVDVVRDNHSVYDAGVDIGDPLGPLEVIVDSRGGALSGTAQASAVVLVVPSERRSNPFLYKVTTANTSGAFLFRGVAPGNYKVFAFKKIPTNAWHNADYFSRFEDLGTALLIEPGKAVDGVRVESIPAAP